MRPGTSNGGTTVTGTKKYYKSQSPLPLESTTLTPQIPLLEPVLEEIPPSLVHKGEIMGLVPYGGFTLSVNRNSAPTPF